MLNKACQLFVFALVILTLASAPIHAQTIKESTHFTGMSMGFQDSKISGSFITCIAPDSTGMGKRLITCLDTNTTGTVSGIRAAALYEWAYIGPCSVLTKTAAGMATGQGGSLGGSYDLGGGSACAIPEKYSFGFKGLTAFTTVTWQKNNVDELVNLIQSGGLTKQALTRFGEQTAFVFGVGKRW